MAADLPKSGNYNLEFNGYGTFSVTMIGKERGLATWDENGAWRGNNGGFGDHMTFHCSGRNNIVSGKAQIGGNCVGLDTGGDQLVFDVTGTFVPGTPDPAQVDIKLTTGTGKYEKISGGGPGVCHFAEFKTAVEVPTSIIAPILAVTSCRSKVGAGSNTRADCGARFHRPRPCPGKTRAARRVFQPIGGSHSAVGTQSVLTRRCSGSVRPA